MHCRLRQSQIAVPLLLLFLSCFQPAFGQKVIRLTAAQKRQMETYFSNYSEADLAPFEAGKLTNRAMIAFGIQHNFRNNANRFKVVTGTSDRKIAAHYIEESARKYFGKEISHHESPDSETRYQDGFYLRPFGEGDVWSFSQIREFRSLGNNRYSALLSVYLAPGPWGGDVHAPQSSWQDDGPGIPKLTGRLLATVKKVTDKGKSRYILLAYRKRND